MFCEVACDDGPVMPRNPTPMTRDTGHGPRAMAISQSKPTRMVMTEAGAKGKSRRINRARLASPARLWRPRFETSRQIPYPHLVRGKDLSVRLSETVKLGQYRLAAESR